VSFTKAESVPFVRGLRSNRHKADFQFSNVTRPGTALLQSDVRTANPAAGPWPGFASNIGDKKKTRNSAVIQNVGRSNLFRRNLHQKSEIDKTIFDVFLVTQ
jgi:hypothetical protein